MTTDRQAELTGVVGICGSAGGVESLKKFFEAMSPESGLAFLVVLHLSPDRESNLAELLSHQTSMSTEQASDGVAIEPNRVYVIPPNSILTVEDRTLKVAPPDSDQVRRRSIDILFKSLAAAQEERAVGVLLSGCGSDGTVGLMRLKEAGGLTIVQTPSSSDEESMPRSALSGVVVDHVLPPAEIAEFLTAYTLRATRAGWVAAEDSPEEKLEQQLQTVCAHLSSTVGYDFRLYKRNTMWRRVHRRMLINGVEELSAYINILRRKPDEVHSLYRELLISVTGFFRDPDSFKALFAYIRDTLIPYAEGKIRVWVPACATGEEAYSIAILLVEALEQERMANSVQIFATDIDEKALQKAREGQYSEGIIDQIGEERLARFFSREGEHFVVSKQLRSMCLFSKHNTISDPPFSRLNLVSCRNLLIYLQPELQSRVLRNLHYGLVPEGLLFLGQAESLSGHTELFYPVDQEHKIFEAQAVRKSPLPVSLRGSSVPVGASDLVERSGKSLKGAHHPRRAERFPPELFSNLGLTVLVFDENNRILDSYGKPDLFFAIASGPPADDIISLAREEVRIPLRTAVHSARKEGQTYGTTFRMTIGGEDFQAELCVVPGEGRRKEQPSAWFAVIRLTQSNEDAAPLASFDSDPVVTQLESELESTKEHLQSTVQELEHSNQELRSSNEELHSMNEELQSSNEELETSKEELQSVNEELETVNSELQEKVAELNRAHTDLWNLFESTPNPIIFLDSELRVQQFTPPSRDLFRLIASDVGRPITDITFDLEGVDLKSAVEQVLETSEVADYSLRSRRDPDKYFSLRILPYRNFKSETEGVVLSFFETTSMEATRRNANLQTERQRELAQVGADALRSEELHSLFRRALVGCRKLLQVELALFLVPTGAPDELAVFESVGWGQKKCPDTVNIEPGTFLQRLSGADRPLPFSLGDESRSTWEQEHQLNEALGLRLRNESDCYGYVLIYRQSVPFTLDETGYLTALGNILLNAQLRSEDIHFSTLKAEVTSVLGRHQNLEEAGPLILRTFAEHLDVAVLEVWNQTSDGYLSCRHFQAPHPEDEDERLRRHFDNVEFRPGVGVVGTAFSEQSVVWCQDLFSEQNFPRAEEAEELGLVSGIGIPLVQDQECLGVLTAFSRRPLVETRRARSAFSTIGAFIGEFIRRTQAEQILRDREALLHKALKKAPIPLCLVTEDGEITVISEMMTRLTGYEHEEISHIQDWTSKAYPLESSQKAQGITKLFDLDEPMNEGEFLIATKHDKELTWEFFTAPLGVDPMGRRTIISMAHDVTDREQHRRELEKVSARKDKFLATLGHELRNPLAAIRNSAVLLLDPTVDEESRKRWSRVVARQSEQMSALLDGLLDLTRISRGKVWLEKRPTELGELTGRSVEAVLGQISGRDLELSFEAPEHAVWARVDPTRWTQIVDNLLNNALKFTPDSGRVEVSLSSDGRTVEFKIADSGKGISPENLEDVFEPFHQEQNQPTAGQGLGLGLALVKHLVERHEGRTLMESEGVGKGTTVTVRIPACDRPEEIVTPAVEVDFADWDILLVEDVEDISETLKAILERSGCSVRTATNAEKAQRLFQDRRPDLVLCDLRIEGDKSGLDLVAALKSEDSSVPALAVTGYGLREDESRCLEAGFDGHLAKPISLDRLTEELRRFSDWKLARGTRVLVVDDNPIILMSTKTMLERVGLVVATARNLKEVKERRADFTPQVCLVDFHLEGEDGYQAAELLQQKFPPESTTYILMTGEADLPENRDLFHRAVVKPVSTELVLGLCRDQQAR